MGKTFLEVGKKNLFISLKGLGVLETVGKKAIFVVMCVAVYDAACVHLVTLLLHFLVRQSG